MFRFRRPSPALVIAFTALFVALGGGAYAAATSIPNGSVTHSKLAKNAVRHDNINSGAVHHDSIQNGAVHNDSLSPWVQNKLRQPGPRGKSGFNGAFYSVENYTGAVTTGAIATAACDPNDATNSQKYAAISGGVQDTDSSTDMRTNTKPLPIVASFPGRMDYDTFTPKPGRLDGWIVQFGNSSIQGSEDNNLVVWALCVPVADDGGQIPVVTNSTTTG